MRKYVQRENIYVHSMHNLVVSCITSITLDARVVKTDSALWLLTTPIMTCLVSGLRPATWEAAPLPSFND